jgi:hypothetical protein
MKSIVLNPTSEQIELAWSAANILPETNPELSRSDRHGATMQRDKFGDKHHQAGWLVVQLEGGRVEAINQFFRLPASARAPINMLKHSLSR